MFLNSWVFGFCFGLCRLILSMAKIKEKLGSKTPVITNAASGIIGIDAFTDEIREVSFEFFCSIQCNSFTWIFLIVL